MFEVLFFNPLQFLTRLMTVFSILILCSCSTSIGKSYDSQSVVILHQSKSQIVENLASIIINYGYYLYIDEDDEVVFETHPDQQSLLYYANYEKNNYNDYNPGNRNRHLQLPHYQIIFLFTAIKNGYLIESTVNFKAWRHLNDQNKNSQQGPTIQRILNELKSNSQMDIANTQYRDYQTIHHLLKYNISTKEEKSFKRMNYIRKIVLSADNEDRRVRAMMFAKQQLKNYCNYSGGFFEEANDNILYSSDGLKIPNLYYNSFNQANNLKAFGMKSCVSEEGVMWRLVIKPKILKPEKKSKDVKTNQKVTKFDNPEMFLFIQMLGKRRPDYKTKNRDEITEIEVLTVF